MQFSTVPSASFRSWQRENENDTSQDGIHYRSGKSPPIARLISQLKQQDSHSLPPGRSARNLLEHLDNNHLAGLMCVSSVPFSVGDSPARLEMPPQKPLSRYLTAWIVTFRDAQLCAAQEQMSLRNRRISNSRPASNLLGSAGISPVTDLNARECARSLHRPNAL
jgi:hypothetical protein